jgi:hypothetical protein
MPPVKMAPPDAIEKRFRSVTVLQFNEIQLLKARKYRSLVAALRTRLSAVISLAVVIAIKPILAYQTAPDRALIGVSIVAVSLIWVLPRFHRLNRLEFLTRERADDDVGGASKERDTVPVQESKRIDALIEKVDGDQDCGFEELQTEIRRTGTLSYSDIQRLKAGEFTLVLHKLRARTCIYCGIGGCFLTMMAWAFRDEPIALIIVLALIAAILARSITRLRRIAHLKLAANAFVLRGATTDQPCNGRHGRVR